MELRFGGVGTGGSSSGHHNRDPFLGFSVKGGGLGPRSLPVIASLGVGVVVAGLFGGLLLLLWIVPLALFSPVLAFIALVVSNSQS